MKHPLYRFGRENLKTNRKSSIFFVVCLVSCCFFLLLSCSCSNKDNNESKRASQQPSYDVILISLDTLRADHLGCYGYDRETSPALDRLAQESVVFDNAFSQSPNTLISHATMLTSLPPSVHGATPDYVLAEGFDTLAEYFAREGYVTACFATHESWLSKKMGFAQGFDIFHSDFIDARQNNRLIFDFLDKHGDTPFFLFLHYYDIHSDYHQLPYTTYTDFDKKFCASYQGDFKGCHLDVCASQLLDKVNSGEWNLTDEEIAYIQALYDGGIAYTDHYLEQLFERLKQLGLYEKCLIVITADHGEEFLEHGKVMHVQLYREVMHVPLIVKLPYQTGHKRIPAFTGVIDIMPSLLDFMEIRYEHVMGRSFIPLIKNQSLEEHPVFSTLRGCGPQYSGTFSAREGKFSYFTKEKYQRFELYDLENDRNEKKNVYGNHKAEGGKFLKELREYLDIIKKIKKFHKHKRKKSEMSKEELDRLKSLGYLNDGG